MKPQLIVIENQTSPGVMSGQELAYITEALCLQAHRDYNTSPWVERGYCAPAIVVPLGVGSPYPKGAWKIILLDDTTQAGALGYHEDEDGYIPFSDVFVKTCREDHTPVSECASHEMIEMLCDPFVDKPKTVQHHGFEYIREVCDPVQDCGYDAGNGQIVSDFVWPLWFGLEQTRAALSQRHSIQDPFQLAAQGYISRKPIGASENEWGQIFGETRTVLPKWASRLSRIHHGSIK